MKNFLIPSDLGQSFVLKSPKVGIALSIGNFDGVHAGHRHLLGLLQQEAKRRQLKSCIMTFVPHPREYFAELQNRPELIPTRISTLRNKVCELRQAGIDQVLISRFDINMERMSAPDFIQEIIVNRLNTKYLMVGKDFRFGYKRHGDVALLQEFAKTYGFEVQTINDVMDQHYIRYSSTELRFALALANLDKACHYLKHNYCISGRVIHGKKLGRTLGVPTINIRVMPHCALLSGVYVVRVQGLGDNFLPGIASLGVRPSVEQQGKVLLEVHLLDTSVDAYGKLVNVEFLQFVRDEEKFSNLETLINAMHNDISVARNFFAVHGL